VILSIETSTTVTSAALHEKGKLVAQEITHVPNSAASQLAVMIDKIMKQHPGTLDAVAVSGGPGSYTGLRIGTATAKGLCYALSVPLISINTLELMSYQTLNSKLVTPNSLMAPMIDARRMEVYTMLLNDKLEILQPVTASIIDATSYSDILNYKKIFFFGNGSSKCREILTHPNANFIDDIFPSAEWMGEMAFDLFKKGKFEDAGDFEPLYLKDFVAKKPKSLV